MSFKPISHADHTPPQLEVTPDAKRSRGANEQSVTRVRQVIEPLIDCLRKLEIFHERDDILLRVFDKPTGRLTQGEVHGLCHQVLLRIFPGVAPCELEELRISVLALVRERQDLVELDFEQGYVSEVEMRTIGSLTSLKSLSLAQKGLEDTQIGPLSRLTNLTELDLSGNHLVGDGLAILTTLVRLEKLNLLENGLGEGSAFPFLTQLRTLSLNTIEKMLPHLTGLRNLTELNYETDIDNADLANLGKMTTLVNLNLANTHFPISNPILFGHLAPLTQLRNLILYNVRTEDGKLLTGIQAMALTTQLAAFIQLERLSVSFGSFNDAMAGHLAKLTSLSSLELMFEYVEDAPILTLDPLYKLPRLTKLILLDFHLDTAIVQWLTQRDRFAKLTLDGCTTSINANRHLDVLRRLNKLKIIEKEESGQEEAIS